MFDATDWTMSSASDCDAGVSGPSLRPRLLFRVLGGLSESSDSSCFRLPAGGGGRFDNSIESASSAVRAWLALCNPFPD